jgi:hypothetical protein
MPFRPPMTLFQQASLIGLSSAADLALVIVELPLSMPLDPGQPYHPHGQLV